MHNRTRCRCASTQPAHTRILSTCTKLIRRLIRRWRAGGHCADPRSMGSHGGVIPRCWRMSPWDVKSLPAGVCSHQDPCRGAMCAEQDPLLDFTYQNLLPRIRNKLRRSVRSSQMMLMLILRSHLVRHGSARTTPTWRATVDEIWSAVHRGGCPWW